LGAIRLLPFLVFVQAVVSLGVLALAARYGLQAAVASTILTVPLNVFLSVLLVRRHLKFTWTELWLAMSKSAAVTLIAATGPLAVVLASGRGLDLSVANAVIAGPLAFAGWLFGVRATRHPLWREVLRVRKRIFGHAGRTALKVFSRS
jgi:hypothetical protein